MLRKIFFMIIGVMFSVQSAFAVAETVSPELQNSLKTTSNDPSPMTIIFALCFVVFLIYITGIIYSKLNLVGAKTVKEQLKRHDLAKAVVISTTQLGQNKNIHVIELNGKSYLIGATATSINLIKDLGEVSDLDDKPVNSVSIENIEQNKESSDEINEDLDIYKKYL